MQLTAVQQALQASGIDGWLFYDFRGLDPLAISILGLDPRGHATRRWFYWVPAQGEPRGIVHSIERGVLNALPGDKLVYLPWPQLHEHLQHVLRGARRVAMQYSPKNAIPYVARVDAGTIELVRSCGVEVVSSADLVARFQATLTREQVATHHAAGEKISRLIDETFAEIGRRVAHTGATTEYEIQQFLWRRYAEEGLEADYPPIVAAGAHSADPHYMPAAEGSARIERGSFVLLDTWARLQQEHAIYFDVTWTAYLGEAVPHEIAEVFQIVRQARDAAVSFVQKAVRSRQPVAGWQLDDAARVVIRAAGFAEAFLHRTGHSIHTATHGNGANLDNLETRDERLILPHTCFSVEPGIYLEGRFGVRSEVNVYVSDADAVVTGRAAQEEIVRIPV